jgi:hypothetical protein
MAKEYVPIFFEWLDVTQDLTAEEKGNLIDAVVSYASGREYEHLLTGACKIAFRFLKGQVDRNAAISDIRRQARQGKTQQPITNDNKTEQTISKFPKEKEKDKDKEKEKEKDIAKPPRRFTPPTVDEVRAYCRERGNHVDPERFVDFYTAKGWRVGNQPMKDWKAAVRTWERNRADGQAAVPAQDYHQRDYNGAQEDALARMMALDT